MERRKRQKSDGRQNHIAQSDRTGGDLWIRFRLGRNFYISPIAHVWSPLSRRLHRSEAGCWARSRAGVFGEHLTKALPTRSRQFNDAWVMESLIMELRKLEEAAKLRHRETDMSVSSSAECQGSDTLHPMKRPLKSPVQHCVCQQSNCCGRHTLIRPFWRQHHMRPIREPQSRLRADSDREGGRTSAAVRNTM
jgi:hypothetical protein